MAAQRSILANLAAEAESHLAALDAREKVLKEEISKGLGSGFTELSSLRGLDGIVGRRSLGDEWRSRRSASSASLGFESGLRSSRLGGSPSSSGKRGPGSDIGSIVFNADDHDD